MTKQLAGIRPSWGALLVLPLLVLAGQALAMEPAVDSNRKADSGAPTGASKSARQDRGPSAPKRAKQPVRGEQSQASPEPRKAAKAPIAGAGATGKQDQVPE
ncbi:MAG: hypothetical protein D4R84_15280, partial [Rhodocyclaceae bacterium]